MKRMSRDTLRMRIGIALTVLKPYQKRAVGVGDEHTREAVTEDLVRRIMGTPESEAVILQPDLVGSPHSPRHGKWDVDEPHPFPDLPFAEH